MANMLEKLDEKILDKQEKRDVCHEKKQFEMALDYNHHVETLLYLKMIFLRLDAIEERIK